MKKRKLFYIASILLLLSGCYDDISDILNDAPINKDGSIAFRTDSILTRGTPQDNLEAYDAVHLMVYSHKNAYSDDPSLYRQTELKKSKSADTPPVWEYSPHMFWPEGRKLSFLAYAVEEDIGYATATGKEGVFIRENAENEAPTIEYSVPTTDVTQQPDLLVTALLNHEKVNNVTLPMKHALSCVSFCATGPENMRVKNIQLKNIYRRATLELDDPSITWTLDPKSKDNLTVLEPGIESDKPLEEDPKQGNYLMTADGYLMMIPQTLTDATIDVTYQDETNNKKEITTQYTLPTTIVWEPGKKYIYKFGEDFEEVVVYYEKYSDGSYGFQWDTTKTNSTLSHIIDTKDIVEAGYGVLTKSRLVSATPNIQLGTTIPIAAKKVVGIAGGYDLYTVNQTGTPDTDTFVLPPNPAPVEVFFDGNNVPCGKIIPHFAKGVSDWNLDSNAIRTPQQMRNISALTAISPDYDKNPTFGTIYKQERDLDFSLVTIGGGSLTNSVVDDVFYGTYNSDLSKSISKVTIEASDKDNVGLFSRNKGNINDVILKSSSIKGKTNVGGIAGENFDGAIIKQSQVMGDRTFPATISGISVVGGIVGSNLSLSQIIGNTDLEVATEVTIATVSGWVTISGNIASVGGIVGRNEGTIKTVLVNGVLVTDKKELTESKIIIKGGYYVGGIVGENWSEVIGNATVGAQEKNMPDVAGIVEITGTTAIGGLVGINAQGSRLNSGNIRLGRHTPMVINGSGNNVGGIVGENAGVIESPNAFISTRGNIHITGLENVGGIVGNNSSDKATLENCFVYDFQTQDLKTYYAPKIKSTGINVGGIVGNNNGASIKGCGVFSSSDTIKIITEQENAGGIAGFNGTGSTTKNSSVVGRVKVEAILKNAGGFFGSNGVNTTISKDDCWIGSTDGNKLLENARINLGLTFTPPSGDVYGTPFITGGIYIGGVVGMNASIIDGITLSDNINIGNPCGTTENTLLSGSNWVGGIVGGNSPSFDGTNQSVIKNCKVINGVGIVNIRGSLNLGGIAGLNNGVIDNCHVSGTSTTPLHIIGIGTIGGVIGQNGSHKDIIETESGNDHTSVRNSSVTGYVTLQGNPGGWETAIQVGGIVGLNGPTKVNFNNIENCFVKGNNASSIQISVGGTTGGIAGKNSGNINKCDVANATIKSNVGYAGGIAGLTIATANTSDKLGYRSDINDCRVYSGVAITGTNSNNIKPGALIGYLNSTVNIVLGSTKNQVNNSGVSVNGTQPTSNSLIVGYVTGSATIGYTVNAVLPRP